jgi:hypothetical protein
MRKWLQRLSISLCKLDEKEQLKYEKFCSETYSFNLTNSAPFSFVNHCYTKTSYSTHVKVHFKKKSFNFAKIPCYYAKFWGIGTIQRRVSNVVTNEIPRQYRTYFWIIPDVTIPITPWQDIILLFSDFATHVIPCQYILLRNSDVSTHIFTQKTKYLSKITMSAGSSTINGLINL